MLARVPRTNDPESASVAETVQHFITGMDALKLHMVAVDQVGEGQAGSMRGKSRDVCVDQVGRREAGSVRGEGRDVCQ